MKAKYKIARGKQDEPGIQTWSHREIVQSLHVQFPHAHQSDFEISNSLTQKSKTVKVCEFFSSTGIAISISRLFGQSLQP
jgi:hypothetical protein